MLDKEKTFAKIIERTAKLHAYQQALSWAESSNIDKDTILWWLKEKAESHEIYLNELDVFYDYCTQCLHPKKEDE